MASPSNRSRTADTDSAVELAVCCACWFASVAYLRGLASPPAGIAIGALLIAAPAAILSALQAGKRFLRARAGRRGRGR
ncbi:hypothetical protein Q4S45_10780 [Massilia sp. R2A-15]|uniref:hypothetical protein n=1 Tax=Massilia sp. R2A-15 TaxID=3064278 RepID=UPI002733EA6C|nr:hypothetical protein [Massilia sp. R2A-15]WLI91575.1 hypothetical protein Q4S45_10780 [Massilia sp. R2A-15]